MTKFKKGDICKVVSIDEGDAFSIGEIVIVMEYSNTPFCKSALCAENDKYAMNSSDLELLQGSELEAFLKEYPEYRKWYAPSLPSMKECRFEDCEFQGEHLHGTSETYSEKINMITGEKIEEEDPTDIMNVKAGDTIQKKSDKRIVIDVLPNSLLVQFPGYGNDVPVDKHDYWCQRKYFSEEGWKIVTDAPTSKETVTVLESLEKEIIYSLGISKIEDATASFNNQHSRLSLGNVSGHKFYQKIETMMDIYSRLLKEKKALSGLEEAKQ